MPDKVEEERMMADPVRIASRAWKRARVKSRREKTTLKKTAGWPKTLRKAPKERGVGRRL